MRVREVLRLLERDGWYLVIQRGSHKQYKHPVKKGRVTIVGQPGDTVATGTLISIFKQAGLRR